jgi:hypothetical protein
MLLSINTLSLLLQATALASTAPPATVRVWRSDSTAYVALREPGHVVLLHVDAIGRIRVLFPAGPDDSTAVSADAPLAVPLPPVAEGNPATFVAVRTRWPFAWGALRSGSDWDYANAWLLQPTAGDPLTALLDIADRVTDGRPYDYGQVTYSRRGAVVARGPAVQPDVCLTCYRHASPAPAPATVATNNVDCTNASLTNSFCGVNSGSVSIASAPSPVPAHQVIYQPAPAPALVYVPYFVPITHGFRRRVDPSPVASPPTAPASQGVAFPIAPQLSVPSGSQLRTWAGRRP